jgi:ABC-2 type transport system permease protein
MRALGAQTRIELLLTLRRGESVLLTFLIPVLLLAFFSKVDVLPTEPGVPNSIDSLYPGVVALAIMSTAMVSLAIATGFERSTGVLKRLGATPLSRPELLGAKTLAMGTIMVLQLGVLTAEALILGFRFSTPALGIALLGAIIATVAFAGLGLLMAGSLPALTTLALANGVYLLMLLLGGMLFPISKLPDGLRQFAEALPSGALSEILHTSLVTRGPVSGHAWLVLVAWAVLAPVAAAFAFRWE